ncbi:MAG TPA: transglycosylase family protein [Microthrixaceae bacterium]|nr:transglycosylase family protein [Microthrixaceae bacterium]HRW41364.1 transglycosylase family protein [Microthrixaceae bacterium]
MTTSPRLLRRRSPSVRSPFRRRIGVAAVAASVLVGLAAPVGSEPLAGADPVAVGRQKVAAAAAARQRAESRLAQVVSRRTALEQRSRELDGADAASTEALAGARRRVRELAVAAFIDGGRTELLQASLTPDEAAVVAWRVGMVSGGADTVSDAVDHFEALRSANDPEQEQVASELDAVRSEEEQARSDLVQSSAAERDATAALDASRREQAAARAARASSAAVAPTPRAPAAPGRRSTARPSPSSSSAAGLGVRSSGGAPTADEAAFLARVRQCESRGNYQIVSSTGRYRGAYQFSVETWRGVGGSGDPAAASPAEQDARALALLRLQGKRAWPVCSGR